MITKQFYDIGIAVSTDDGLLVPFVRDCDKKNFAEIEQEIANLAVKARDKKLGLDDMVNGSFTITNGGIFGSMMSTPIINGNQAAILGMHSIITRPIAVDKDTIENRPMMYIALSYDHRIIDGKEAVGFLKPLKNSLKILKIYYLNHNLEPNILKNNDVNGTDLKQELNKTLCSRLLILCILQEISSLVFVNSIIIIVLMYFSTISITI